MTKVIYVCIVQLFFRHVILPIYVDLSAKTCYYIFEGSFRMDKYVRKSCFSIPHSAPFVRSSHNYRC